MLFTMSRRSHRVLLSGNNVSLPYQYEGLLGRYWRGIGEVLGIDIRDGIGRGYKKPPIKKSMCGMGNQTEIPLRIP